MKKKLAKCLVLLGILLVTFPAGVSSAEIEEDELIWGIPEVIEEIVNFMQVNECKNIGKLGVTDDELKMVVCLENCTGGEGRWDLWMFTRGSTNEPWGNGVNLNDICISGTHGRINTSSEDYSLTITGDGSLLIWETTRSGGKGAQDLWQSEWVWDAVDEEWKWGPATPMTNIPEDINSPQVDADPGISTDGLELYFASERPGSEDRDIWVTRRNSTSDSWDSPINLDTYNEGLGGESINSSSSDQDMALSSDDLHLFLTSNRSGDYDIYWWSRENVGTKWKKGAFGLESLYDLDPIINSGDDEVTIEIVGDTLYMVREDGKISGIERTPYVFSPLLMIKTTIVSIGSSGKAERTVMVRGGLGLLDGTFVPKHWLDQKGVPEQYLYLIHSEE